MRGIGLMEENIEGTWTTATWDGIPPGTYVVELLDRKGSSWGHLQMNDVTVSPLLKWACRAGVPELAQAKVSRRVEFSLAKLNSAQTNLNLKCKALQC